MIVVVCCFVVFFLAILVNRYSKCRTAVGNNEIEEKDTNPRNVVFQGKQKGEKKIFVKDCE